MKQFDGDIAVAPEHETDDKKALDLRSLFPTIVVRAPLVKPSVNGAVRTFKERKILATIVIVLLIAGMASLAHKMFAKPAAVVNAAIPVTVQTIATQNIRLWSEFPARLQAVDFAEIRPEVSGRITEVRIEDGQYVHKGDVMFVIDPAPYEAAMNKAQANVDFSKTEVDRAQGLVKAQAIAQRLYDERSNASLVAQADLARAKVDYARAFVAAPISGRVSRPELTVGNLVQTSPNAPLLTSIVSSNGIYADFEVDEQTYLQTIRDHASARDQERQLPVELTVPGDAAHVYKGTIYSFDNHIDTVSGTIRARAKFPNRDGVLLPGMFGSIKIGGSRETPTLLVPERAVGNDQSKKFLYVVGSNNKVVYREVTLGKQVGSDRVVLSGLNSGERVIVDGTQHVRPDALVDPKDVATPATPTAPQTATH